MKRFLWTGFDSPRRLSAEETAELAAQLAQLTKSGVPLEAGLRALAAEVPSRRLRRVLRAMADQLDAGSDLATAIEAQGRRLPAYLRGLVLAGIRSGRLPEVLQGYVDIEQSRLELRPVWLTFVYPFIVLTLMFAIATLGRLHIVGQYEKIYEDFGTGLPTLTTFVLWIWGPTMWCLAGLMGLPVVIQVMLWLGPATDWVWPALHRVPIVGPLLQWSHLAQFSRLLSLLLETQVPLSDSLRLTAAGLRDADLACGCRGVADEVDRGRSLDESLAAWPQFPATLVPVVQWGQQASALPDAFRGAAEMFEGRSRAYRASLEAMLLPIWWLAGITVGGIFVLFAIALWLPLLALFGRLSA